MFTGIVRGIGRIVQIKQQPGLMQFGVTNNELAGLQKGASVAVNGVCLTAVSIDSTTVWFDVIEETLNRTNLISLHNGDLVNLERAARFGDEIGGHILSGHIFGTAKVLSIQKSQNNCVVSFQCPKEWIKYLFPKGYVALNGASLTLVDVDKKKDSFSVHLIPETLQNTIFGTVKNGDLVNLEVDAQTQAIVDTIERMLK